MKHISGDEALQLKDKLDARSSGGTMTSPAAAPTCSGLTEWMSAAEACLQSVEPREEDILRLEGDIQEFRPVLDNINLIGPQLCQISPGEGATHVEGIVTATTGASTPSQNKCSGRPSGCCSARSQPALVRAQLKAQRPLNDDVAAQRVRVRDLLSQAKKMLQQSIAGHKPLVDKLVKTGEALARLCGEEDAAKVQDVVEADCERYNALKAELRTRQQALEQALQESSQFADKLEGMLRALAGTHDQLARAEPVSAHPPKIQDQIEENNALIEDLEKRTEAYNAVQRAASDVISKASKSDPAVRDIRNKLEKLHKLWDDVQKATSDRGHSLDSALEIARKFWQQLDALMLTLAELQDTLAAQPPPAAQPRAIQAQQVALQEIRHEIDHTKPEVEKVRKTGSHLMSLCGEPDKPEVKKHMEDLDSAWDNNLQEFLDTAEDKFSRMGALGSDIDAVKRQISQLASFKQEVDPHMVKVEALNSPNDSESFLVAGDPQILEVELAKLKVLVNDIAAHQASVDTLNDAGASIVQQGNSSEEAGETAEKLATLNRKWRELQQKARDRQSELEDALREAQSFNAEIGDLLSWLSEVDGVIAASKPVGGLPETASEQLESFSATSILVAEQQAQNIAEVYNEVEANRPKVEAVLQQGQEYLRRQDKPNPSSQLTQNLKNLKSRWDNITVRASDKKIKLEIALKEATEFHDALQAFVDWLTSAEKTLGSAKPVSRVMETLLVQIEEHKSFQKEVSTHRETMLQLDKKGTHLKYFSQKQDVILIKNLLVSVQHRWERVVAKNNMMNWLTDTEKQLDDLNVETTVNDPEKIKQRLSKHREFQKALAGKQPSYDQTMKVGKQLKDKAPKGDEPALRNMLQDLKTKWTTVCSKAVDRTRRKQRK
ncbi:hypothetical protein MSG28_013810 [Choristoneura fumiferana]|uniref:Uncharacterized protein n=1 Tax=Choristoneura fumiferana TaxID=7141 RepID=A0ACC0K934_CHOFU|nr:hypothetical protein MSG28_013810 [Choristoneura fumiferana]